ncbi:hypothetical protein SprV_0100337900 [Sparganum proliferum]
MNVTNLFIIMLRASTFTKCYASRLSLVFISICFFYLLGIPAFACQYFGCADVGVVLGTMDFAPYVNFDELYEKFDEFKQLTSKHVLTVRLLGM